MRTIIDLPKKQLIPLDTLARDRGVSRAELVRQAVELLLKKYSFPKNTDLSQHPAFGIWKARKEDAVSYQRRLRAEWD